MFFIIVFSVVLFLGKANGGYLNFTAEILKGAIMDANQTNSGVFVLFTKENCPKCISFEIVAMRAYLLLRNDPDFKHIFGNVNTRNVSNRELIKQYNITNVPTAYILGPENNYKPILYKGEATGEALASAVRASARHIPKRLNDTNDLTVRIDSLMESFLLGIFETKGELYEKFMNASRKMPLLRFYYLLNSKLDEKYVKNVKDRANFVLIFHNPFFTKDDNESQVVLFNETVHSTIEIFIASSFSHLIEICTQQTLVVYKALRLPYLSFFTRVYDNLNVTKEIGRDLKPIAWKYFDYLRICISNIDQGGILDELIGIEEGQVIIFKPDGSVYQEKGMYGEVDGVERVKSTELSKWIEKYLSGLIPGVNVAKKLAELKKNMTEKTKNETTKDHRDEL